VLVAAMDLPEPFSAAVETAGGLMAGASLFAIACLVWQVPEALACAKYMHWAGDAVTKKFQRAVRP